MKLAVQTDYALRSLMLLAMQQKRITIEQIANFFDIPASHVAKSVGLLARNGYVRSIRGIGGGIELQKPASEINIGEVILLFEGNLHLLDCVGIENICSIQPACKLKEVLAQAERIQLEYLNSVTLQQVLPVQEKLQTLSLPTEASS